MRSLRLWTAIVTGMVVFLAVGAQTATAAPNVELGRQYGVTLRAELFEHINRGGGRIAVYGSSVCTATYADAEYSQSYMPSGWNDVVSWIADYNQCDVKLWEHIEFGGTASLWYNGGSYGVYVGDPWNDRASSFKLS